MPLQTILLFGAGKSATFLIQYLLQTAAEEEWQLWVVDANPELAQSKTNNHQHGKAISFDIENALERAHYISNASIVISLLPPHLHILVAKDCIRHKKNLLTASYVDEAMDSLRSDIEASGLLFLCEMGLDPGIDHMSAKKIIDNIQSNGGAITSFRSHCGGLAAPPDDDNPWHYKISWNPRNVVNAGKDGASFKENGEVKILSYKQLFEESRYVNIPGNEALCWYPNRDSVRYASLYGLNDCPTFIRTTLRHPDFIYGWRNIVELKLTDETLFYQTDGKTLMDFFKEHMDSQNFSGWLEQKLQEHFKATQGLLNSLIHLTDLDESGKQKKQQEHEDIMVVTENGSLEEVDIDDMKYEAASAIAAKMHEAKLTLRQLYFLGLDDQATVINKGRCSAAAVLQFILENKLALQEADKDMVVMMHEIEYILNGTGYQLTSAMVVEGSDAQHTAMAKTVGLPLGIAAKLMLKGGISLRGLHIPTVKEIYEPLLQALKEHGIDFKEEVVERPF